MAAYHNNQQADLVRVLEEEIRFLRHQLEAKDQMIHALVEQKALPEPRKTWWQRIWGG